VDTDDPKRKEQTYRGIYELKNKELRICFRVGSAERPSDFERPDEQGKQRIVIVFKRAKSAGSEPLTATRRRCTTHVVIDTAPTSGPGSYRSRS
jgi:hypothetical protein